MSVREPSNTSRPKTSTRDYDKLRAQLEEWLGQRVPGAAVSALVVPAGNGMSSETVLFDLTVPGEEPRELVARIAPDPAADPVFMVYDMERQFKTMQMVAEHTEVPVPKVLWLETGTDAIGVPFFVMERVHGVVPPDLMPYPYGDNWFFDADVKDQQRLERQAVEALAALHELTADGGPAGFLAAPADGASHLRHHVQEQRTYYDWVAADGVRSPLIEETFEWLEEHWPGNENDAVFSWGDARVGNMMFEDFSPVAVLDWEMAAVGPREIDIGWMIYMHRAFQDMVETFGMPGMPHILRRETVAAIYEEASGYKPQDLDFYTAYASLRYAIVMFRITRRSIRFGEAVMPENPDEAIMHHAQLRKMIDGVYWEAV